ncbi:MAG: hypothetical protein ACREXX_04540 [Gammaproteobacteria bacterium]
MEYRTAYGRGPPRRLMIGQLMIGQLIIGVCHGMRNSRTRPILPVRADWRALEDSNL